jgi:putative tricarboxylic transport membrane protein
METLSLLGNGIFVAATDPAMLLAIVIGAVVGLLIGALPGLGPTAGVAIMLPIAVGFDPTVALAMLAGVYYGAMFGGAVTSILLGIPGDAPSVMTVIDGYPMAKNGQAGRALGLATYASFIGGFIGLIGLTLMAQIVSRYALLFGPVEMTALMVLSLSLVTILGNDDPLKSFLSLSA